MGLLSRFVAVVRANLNALLNRAEDPSKMLEQTLLDLEGAYRKAKDQVARSVADQKRLEKSLQDQRNEAAKWGERALLAVRKGDDTLARESLQRKQEHQRISAQFEHEMTAHTQNVEQLRAGLVGFATELVEQRVLLGGVEGCEGDLELFGLVVLGAF